MGYTHDLPKDMTERYVDSDGNECPFCHTDDLNTGERAESGSEVKCLNCGNEWLECTKVVGVLLSEAYVRPWAELKHDAIKDAYRMLHLVMAIHKNASTHGTDIVKMGGLLNRAGIAKTMALCNEYFTRLGDHEEDKDVVYELWEYAARRELRSLRR